MNAIIFDTETTGLDEPEVIETAVIPVDIKLDASGPATVSRYRPSKPITLGAMATHHIMDEDPTTFPPSSSVALPDGIEYLIGHNVDYDWIAIGKPDVKRIDVLAMCRTLWPDADSHSQGAMMYLLYRDSARDLLVGAHSAAADALNCRRLLLKVLEALPEWPEDFEALWQTSERMRIPTKMTFGKHRGMKISDVPRDYKSWLLKQPDVDPYLEKALRA